MKMLHRKERECVQGFGGIFRRKEHTRKIETWVEGDAIPQRGDEEAAAQVKAGNVGHKSKFNKDNTMAQSSSAAQQQGKFWSQMNTKKFVPKHD
jgi:hypothetical protein